MENLPTGQAGKTSKYLKYAIGEIVLVVIGILIALQINNWNEERKLKIEINNYLTQKLENLKDDQERLIDMRNYRIKAEKTSKALLDTGLKNANVFDLINGTVLISVERRFVSTIERNESSIIKYYASAKEAKINKLEQKYINELELMTFEENRLNNFSEAIEIDLWRNGYLVENRDLITTITVTKDASSFTEDIPEFILNDANGLKSLEGMFRRSELASPSIVLKLNQLIETNQELRNEIQNYLNNH
jgi:hypothetical protein